MKTSELRILIEASLIKRYKILCLKHDISVPKQTAELIKRFVESQEEKEKKHTKDAL